MAMQVSGSTASITTPNADRGSNLQQRPIAPNADSTLETLVDPKSSSFCGTIFTTIRNIFSMIVSICCSPVNYFFNRSETNRAEEDDTKAIRDQIKAIKETQTQLDGIQEAQSSFSADSLRQIAALLKVDTDGLSMEEIDSLQERYVNICRSEGYEGDMQKAAHALFHRHNNELHEILK